MLESLKLFCLIIFFCFCLFCSKHLRPCRKVFGLTKLNCNIWQPNPAERIPSPGTCTSAVVTRGNGNFGTSYCTKTYYFTSRANQLKNYLGLLCWKEVIVKGCWIRPHLKPSKTQKNRYGPKASTMITLCNFMSCVLFVGLHNLTELYLASRCAVFFFLTLKWYT